MRKPYDIVIVGAGLFGAACAYELTRQGFRCLVLDKRRHIGGNCYTEARDGINLHHYGPHIFHTSNKAIWEWLQQFTEFNSYRHHPKVNSDGRIYSFPINLFTLHQLWGVTTPAEARERLDRERIVSGDLNCLENWILSRVGREIYELFFKGYTEKQWGKSPAELPASIIKRLPIRLTHDDNYFEDPYQGIPIGGYTPIFTKLLSNVEVRLNTDYFECRQGFDALARRVLFTGPIDRFFDCQFGRLEYRSMRFEHERVETPDYQGVSIMHFTSAKIPFTRIVEHKHFESGRQPVSWITKEYPLSESNPLEPMYPIRDAANQRLLRQYQSLSRLSEWRNFYFGGRMAEFQYYDMHQVIGSALAMVKRIKADLIGRAAERQTTAA